MQRDDDVYVGHMLDLSRKVAAKIAGVPREKFDQDENLRLALAHLLQTIGEAARRVSREFQKVPYSPNQVRRPAARRPSYCAVYPPSITAAAPVIPAPASLTRKTA